MKTTVEFLDEVKSRLGLPSDYALAPHMGVTRAEVSRLRNKKSFLGDATAERVAKLLGIDPAYIIACVHRERAGNSESKAIWQRIADRFTDSNGDPICIM